MTGPAISSHAQSGSRSVQSWSFSVVGSDRGELLMRRDTANQPLQSQLRKSDAHSTAANSP
jgi:hypothetical protein